MGRLDLGDPSTEKGQDVYAEYLIETRTGEIAPRSSCCWAQCCWHVPTDRICCWPEVRNACGAGNSLGYRRIPFRAVWMFPFRSPMSRIKITFSPCASRSKRAVSLARHRDPALPEAGAALRWLSSLMFQVSPRSPAMMRIALAAVILAACLAAGMLLRGLA
jgi:hypothetical protein